MFNKTLFKSELVLKQITATQLAKILNVNKSTVSKKINGKSEFTHSEIQTIGKLIGNDKLMQIFFA